MEYHQPATPNGILDLDKNYQLVLTLQKQIMRQCEVPNTICEGILPKMKNMNLIKDLCPSDILGEIKRENLWVTLNGCNQQNSDYVKCSDFLTKKD